MLEASNQDGTAAAPPRRRITADSFRALQARLAGVPFVPRQEEPAEEIAVTHAPPPPPSNGTPAKWDAWPAAPHLEPFQAVAETPTEIAAPAWEPARPDEIVEPPQSYDFEPIQVEAVAPAPVIEEEPAPAPYFEAAPELVEQAPVESEPAVAFDAAPVWEEPVAAEPPATIEAAPAPEWSAQRPDPPSFATEEAEPDSSSPAVLEPAPQPEEPEDTPLAMEEARRAFAEVAEEAAPPPVAEEPAPPIKPREASILRRAPAAADPFADAMDFSAAAIEAPPIPVVVEDEDDQAGEVARSLIDIMASSAGSSQPQERALAADTLLRLVPRVPVRDLLQIAERVAKMDNPPQLLVSRIIRDPRPEVAAALLERAGNIADQELLAIAAEADPVKLRMMARRRTVSTALADAIVKAGDSSALLTLVRNPGASLSHDAFQTLCELARQAPPLLAPLATRADTPPVVAFQMFWSLPAELRRYVLSRFLTDSETLNRILKITMAVDGGEDPAEAGEAKFPNSDEVDVFLALAAEGKIEEAAKHLAALGGICEETGRRILGDAEGEPLAVLLKSLGLSRSRFADAIERLSQPPASLVRVGRNLAELQGIFDQLSFNKARVLLTYWDWAAQQTGPYAKRAA
jgi:hypothetical protein